MTATRIENTVVHDWQLVEFFMHSWADSELAERDPFEALDPMVIDDIDHPAPLSAAFTFCG